MISKTSGTDEYHFSNSEWEKILKQWEKHQPVIDLITKSGETRSGQLLYANQNEIVVYPGTGLLLNTDQSDKIVHLKVEDINSIILRKGGYTENGGYTPIESNKVLAMTLGGLTLGFAGFTAGMAIAGGWVFWPGIIGGAVGAAGGVWIGPKVLKLFQPYHTDLVPDTPQYEKATEKMRKFAVYPDSLFFPEDLYQALEVSPQITKGLNRPLRISLTMATVPNAIRKDLTNKISSLPEPESGIEAFTLESFDVSWRFSEHYIVGAQIPMDYYSLDNYNNSTNEPEYNYSITALEGGAYFDYVINPANKLYAKPYEFTVGAGARIGVRNVELFYGSQYYSDAPIIYGLQLKSAAYYYPYPGLSLFAGMEANLYNKIRLPAYVLTSNDPLVNFEIPESSIQFSALRIKAGVSIYF
ncbi:MAG: hypothetical protein K9H49_04375 [Bacteroidales bacterium]|nr:hypothetical protein [Bacteroidales bacterium]MCF8389051.1 hypothetical protein [Bacteroidales bacterium]